MNIAVIFAGGVGQRMHSGSTPKQFLKLRGKPIIVYTIEHFQDSPLIDGIIIVSLKEWIPYCEELVIRYGLTKVSAIVSGGSTGFESIGNGLQKANELYPDDSVVLIHDGVRPLINSELIKSDIEAVKKYGSAITVSEAIETIVVLNKAIVADVIDRHQCQIAKAPQCFYLRDILAGHERAVSDGFDDFIDSASLMHHYGFELHTVVGPSDNIKITTPADFFVFKAFVEARENSEIFGA